MISIFNYHLTPSVKKKKLYSIFQRIVQVFPAHKFTAMIHSLLLSKVFSADRRAAVFTEHALKTHLLSAKWHTDIVSEWLLNIDEHLGAKHSP